MFSRRQLLKAGGAAVAIAAPVAMGLLSGDSLADDDRQVFREINQGFFDQFNREFSVNPDKATALRSLKKPDFLIQVGDGMDLYVDSVAVCRRDDDTWERVLGQAYQCGAELCFRIWIDVDRLRYRLGSGASVGFLYRGQLPEMSMPTECVTENLYRLYRVRKAWETQVMGTAISRNDARRLGFDV